MQQGKEEKVYKLRQALYELKQTPRAWYNRIDSHFVKKGFQKCPHKHTLYAKVGNRGKLLVVCLYVDYLIYIGSDIDLVNQFKLSMIKEFETSDLGLMHYVLGIEVKHTTSSNYIY